jgi:transposase
VARSVVTEDGAKKEASYIMLHVGLDLSRKRVDVCVISDQGELVDELAAPFDEDGLCRLTDRVSAKHTGRVRAVVESMNGAGFVHDTLEAQGWDVLVADAQRVKGLAPLALAELSFRDLVPAIWLPDPQVHRERELARFRLHLVRHRSSLKNRIHSTLITFGKPCPVSDLFGLAGRKLLERLQVPEPWRQRRGQPRADRSARPPDRRGRQRAEVRRRRSSLRAAAHDRARCGLVRGVLDRLRDRRHQPLLLAQKLCGYTGLCPRVIQSGETDRRGPISKHGPKYLRWALFEAALNACHHPLYKERYERTKKRLGRAPARRYA